MEPFKENLNTDVSTPNNTSIPKPSNRRYYLVIFLIGIIVPIVILFLKFESASQNAINTENLNADALQESCNCAAIHVNMPGLGVINGLVKQHTYEFLGIPFALPPIGARRWTNPQPYNIPFPKEGYPATFFRPSCYQGADGTTQPQGIAEDCLYLNVFTPKNGLNKKLPVMIWTFGGGNLYGGAGASVPALYNGTNIIVSGQEVIVVTLNYRLGIFTDLYLKELNEEDQTYGTSGQYANLDVQLAYKWVQSNIHLFGGDKTKVLGFGESAGANMAAVQTIMKGSKGLISAAILESGSFGVPFAFATLNDTMTKSRKFVTIANCDGLNSTDTLLCLRKIPAATILQLAGAIGTGFDSLRSGIDGVLLKADPQQLLLDGRVVNRIPIMMGWNTQDAYANNCVGVPDDAELTEVIYNGSMAYNFGMNLGFNETSIERVLKQYPYSKCAVPGNQSATLSRCCDFLQSSGMDYMWRCQARRMLTLESNYTSKTFLYYFGQYPTCPINFPAAGHTDEIAYVFGTESNYRATGLEAPCHWNSTERQFSNKMISLWTSFATKGNPSTPTIPFPRFIPNKQEAGLFLKANQIAPFLLTSDEIDRCINFWEPFLWDMFAWGQSGGKIGPDIPFMDQALSGGTRFSLLHN